MKNLKYLLAIALLISPIIYGCGSSNKSGSVNDQNQQLISSLRSDLDKARKDLEAQVEQNRNLEDQVQSLTGKLDEIEKEAPAISQTPESTQNAGSGAFDSQSRVALMGAKALAEFKAEQLGAKLEKLTREMQIKENELAKAVEESEGLNRELAGMKEALQEKTTTFERQASESAGRMNQMGQEIKVLSSQVNDLKQEISDKDELLVTLKKAWADATQLKTSSESESSRLRTELENVTKQLASYKDSSERGEQEASFFKAELQQAQERLDSATAQLEKLTNENLSSIKELERLKNHSASLANKLYALERAAGIDSENFVTSIDNLISGAYPVTPQETVKR